MRFCTKCGSPVSGTSRFCTRCGAVTSSTAGAGVASAAATGAAATGTAKTGTAKTGTIEAGPVEPGMIEAGPVQAAAVIPVHPGPLPVIPAQFGLADADPGGVPSDQTVPAETAVPEPDQQPAAGQTRADHPEADPSQADQPAADQPAADQPAADQPEADEATPAGLATDQPVPVPQHRAACPATVLPTGTSEDAGLPRLVPIDAGPDHEAWPEDPWLPGSRRPDRRALIIGVVLIAGLLSVASTAWLVRVNPPQASSPHGTHQSRASQLGAGQAQPRQAFSGQPTPILTQPPGQPIQPLPTQAAPAQTGTGPARPGHAGHSQPRHNQPRHNQSSGLPGTNQSGTGSSRPGQPGASQAGTHHTGSGQPGQGQTGSGQGSSPNGSGPSGTGHGTTPAVPHPRRSAPGSRNGGAPRHSRPGIVSIAPGLAGQTDARRVGGLLARYFAAVNHRQYLTYTSLFAQRRQLSPREFAWGYQTSHDSDAVLVGIAALNGGLKATVTFTSLQDPAQSPDHSSCIDWQITLFLHRTGTTYLIGMPPPGYQAGLQACSFAPPQSPQGHSTSRHPTSKQRRRTHH
jgi:zinc-ribbon domain